MQSRDPSTNVVLLEDAAAVLGVIMAAGCMGLTSLTGKSSGSFSRPHLDCSQNCETESLILRWLMEIQEYKRNECDAEVVIFALSSFNSGNLRSHTRGLTVSHQHLSLCVLPGNPYYDSLGSLGVGTLLGTVSAFLIYTNTEALLGRSIQADRVQKLTEFLENDPAVRSAEQKHTHTHSHTPLHS